MKRISLQVLLIVVGVLAGATHAVAKDFNFAGRKSTCKEAVAYREGQLLFDFATAVDNFDSTKEQRISATIAAFSKDVEKISKEIDAADAVKRKRIAVAVTGLVLGAAANKLSTVGVKPIVSEQERKALAAVAGRGAEWYSTFLKYGASGEVDVTSIVAMPASLLLSFSPFGTAEKVWSIGNASIDIASAIAEAEIIKGAANLTAQQTIERAKALAGKLQMPKLIQLNVLKNEIDKQCG